MFFDSNKIPWSTGVTLHGKTSMVKLAQRMTRDFCAGVCGTMHAWQLVQAGNAGEEARLIIRNSMDKPGEPSGVVLSATTSVWMPVSHQSLFDFLRDEQLRSEWDELSHGGPMQEMVHVAKGQDRASRVSLLRATVSSRPLFTEWVYCPFGGAFIFISSENSHPHFHCFQKQFCNQLC